jgi:hypothetical protein
MQFNTFELGEELKLSFNLNISGTSAQPSEVRVILGNGLKLQTLARLGNGGEYEAVLPILPDLFSQGDTTLLIEVVINGKLFTPVKQRVTITGQTVSVNAQTTVPAPEVINPAGFDSEKHELVHPTETIQASGNFISQAELLAAAGIKSESIKPIIKEEEKKPVQPKVVKEAKPIQQKTKLQFDLTEFANMYEPVEVAITESAQEEIKKVKVSTGNFRIQKTKIVTR